MYECKFFILLILCSFCFIFGTVIARGADLEKTVIDVSLPDVVLLNQKAQKVRLTSFLNSKEPVLVDFIFATCTTICPVLSASVAHVQKRLALQNKKVRIVSITIDPENDTPAVMAKYLRRYKAQPGWDFLTGSRNDIDRVMDSFDAFFQDKMDHLPLYFVRGQQDGKWIRIEGFIGSPGLIEEIEKGRGNVNI